ncbi:MAG: AraC family transcriptional regulator [Candidatus Pelagadaptatus aseana]|uniref:AraC family transcriptional regulator n=1 Tax=Candidatus Pelagadaptatus aseana TaxID=3120508 RepID=UPI0039B1598E
MASQLVQNVAALAVNEGLNKTPLPGVCVYKTSATLERAPLCYRQGVIFVVQGRKRIFIDSQGYDYNPDNYLVLTLPMAAECETVVEPGKPMLSLMLDLDLALLGEMVRQIDEFRHEHTVDKLSDAKGLYVSRCTSDLSDAVTRLTRCLNSPLESALLGQGLVREVLYHLLLGPQAKPLFSLVSYNTHLARLEKVLAHLHDHYHQHFEVDQLAEMAKMSASTFHRNFQLVTSSSPKQYIKKLRLNRARELLLDRGLKVNQAASQVGYESPTQFSREFKRYFGESPSQLFG